MQCNSVQHCHQRGRFVTKDCLLQPVVDLVILHCRCSLIIQNNHNTSSTCYYRSQQHKEEYHASQVQSNVLEIFVLNHQVKVEFSCAAFFDVHNSEIAEHYWYTLNCILSWILVWDVTINYVYRKGVNEISYRS